MYSGFGLTRILCSGCGQQIVVNSGFKNKNHLGVKYLDFLRGRYTRTCCCLIGNIGLISMLITNCGD